MAQKPSEILRKTKATDKKEDKDESKESKKPTRNALLAFIAKNKK